MRNRQAGPRGGRGSQGRPVAPKKRGGRGSRGGPSVESDFERFRQPGYFAGRVKRKTPSTTTEALAMLGDKDPEGLLGGLMGGAGAAQRRGRRAAQQKKPQSTGFTGQGGLGRFLRSPATTGPSRKPNMGAVMRGMSGSFGMQAGGKTKAKGMAGGGKMKTKGYMGGGKMKTKGMAGGGKLPMVEKGGKMVPFFAADGKGKMQKGGQIRMSSKMMANGGMTAVRKKEGGNTVARGSGAARSQKFTKNG